AGALDHAPDRQPARWRDHGGQPGAGEGLDVHRPVADPPGRDPRAGPGPRPGPGAPSARTGAGRLIHGFARPRPAPVRPVAGPARGDATRRTVSWKRAVRGD